MPMKYLLILSFFILCSFVVSDTINISEDTYIETNGHVYSIGLTPDGVNTLTGVRIQIDGTGFYDTNLQLIGFVKNSSTDPLITTPIMDVQENAISVGVPFRLKNYFKNDLPDPSLSITGLVYLYSDTTENRAVLWSDGFRWRKINDNSIIK